MLAVVGFVTSENENRISVPAATSAVKPFLTKILRTAVLWSVQSRLVWMLEMPVQTVEEDMDIALGYMICTMPSAGILLMVVNVT